MKITVGKETALRAICKLMDIQYPIPEDAGVESVSIVLANYTEKRIIFLYNRVDKSK